MPMLPERLYGRPLRESEFVALALGVSLLLVGCDPKFPWGLEGSCRSIGCSWEGGFTLFPPEVAFLTAGRGRPIPRLLIPQLSCATKYIRNSNRLSSRHRINFRGKDVMGVSHRESSSCTPHNSLTCCVARRSFADSSICGYVCPDWKRRQ